jgi:hypothetical protein
VHGDLENRLEQESRGKVQLERTLEDLEREWALKYKKLEADRDHWQEVVKVEQSRNARLIDQVVRKDQDIHRMLQQKVRIYCCCRTLLLFVAVIDCLVVPSFPTVICQYDNQRESPITHSTRNVRHLMNERESAFQEIARRGEQQFKSPHEILEASGSMKAVRTRNVKNLLMDFFAL